MRLDTQTKLAVIAFTLAAAFCLTALCLHGQIVAPQVPLTGNIGPAGPFPVLNSGTLVFASDANHTMVNPEWSATNLKVTSGVSLTGTRNLITPAGKFFFGAIENATTGGQAIQIIGVSGTGVTIANGTTVSVWNDGTNYVQVGTAGGGGGSVYVNSSLVSSPNFNPTTPTAPAGATAVVFAVSGSNVSANIPNAIAQLGLTTVESFGALGNSTGVTGNGHDDTAAIQACLTAAALSPTPNIVGCLLQAGKIYRTTGVLTVANPGVTLMGTTPGDTDGGGISGSGSLALNAEIMIDSPSADGLDVNALYPNLQNLSFFRAQPPTGTATGIAFGGTVAGAFANNVTVADNINGVSWLGGGSYGVGSINNISVINNQNTNVTWSPMTPHTCYNLVSDATHSFYSLNLNNLACATPASLTANRQTALSLAGPQDNDVYLHGFNDNDSYNGIVVNCTSGVGCYDIHLHDLILQSLNALTVTTPTGRDTQEIDIAGGWSHGGPGGVDFNITGRGVSIDNFQFEGGTPSSIANSTQVAITNSHWSGNAGVNISNTTSSTFASSTATENGTTPPTAYFNLTGSSNNSFTGLAMTADSGSPVGIQFDPASNNNAYCGDTAAGTMAGLVLDFGTGNGCPSTSTNNPVPLEAWLSQDGGLPLENTGTDSSNTATGSGITFTTAPGFTHPVATYAGGGPGAVAASGTATNFSNTTPFTVSMWEIASTTVAEVSTRSPSGAGWILYDVADTPYFGVGNNGDVNAIRIGTTSPSGAPNPKNVCAVYDGTGVISGLHIYINGVAQTTATVLNTLSGSIAGGNPVIIGASTTGVEGNVNVFANNTTSCANIYAQGPNKVFGSGGTTSVTQIVAGTGVTISPANGIGAVTVTASGGGADLPWYANIQGSLFTTVTMLGPVYKATTAETVSGMVMRQTGTISCSVAPSAVVMDLATSPATAYGGATATGLVVSGGVTDGVYTFGGSPQVLTSGHFYGVAFTDGTCVTAPTFDITMF